MPKPNESGAVSEPVVRAELLPFVEADLRALAPGLARDPQYNDKRLETRRKLLSLAKVFLARADKEGAQLEARTSLHHPHAFNQMQVKRLWAYATRGKKDKSRLKGLLGSDLGKDLDAAYRNAYVCVALEADAVEVSLRFHQDAWFDGQNLLHRIKAEGQETWRGLLNGLDGYRWALADWKGEWPCGQLTRERVDEFLKYYRPGEHAMSVVRRWAPAGADRAAFLDAAFPARLVDEMLRLLPLWRYAAWSSESDWLFKK